MEEYFERTSIKDSNFFLKLSSIYSHCKIEKYLELEARIGFTDKAKVYSKLHFPSQRGDKWIFKET